MGEITGMRDKVVHDYMGVDSELVWTVATTQLEELRNDVQAILYGLQNQSGGTV